jgi:hypothetical protein
VPGVRLGNEKSRWLGGFALLVVLVTVAASSSMGSFARASAASEPAVRPRRLLILSLPGAAWAELDSPGLPNLDRLFGRSALGDLTNRTARGAAHIGDGYATVSAGTRAASDTASGGLAFETTERIGKSSAGQEFARRTGLIVPDGIVHLGITRLASDNVSQRYGAKIGALGDALDAAGYQRAVIANADGAVPDDPAGGVYHRDAATALVDSRGVVPAGSVGTDLLRADPRAPFGVRLDPDKVLASFSSVWRDNSVVLVEASDLARVDAYARYANRTQRAAQLHDALAATDALVGRLLAKVDPTRDAVLTISPSHPAGSNSLGVVALERPGGEPGYLRSATTRRLGFAAIVDTAPTVLNLFGISVPTSMEGQPMSSVHDSTSLADRQAFLVQANADGVFRDQLVDPVQSAYATFAIIVAAGIALLVWTDRHRHLLRFAALGLLAYPTATYLAGPLHFATHGGVNRFWIFVVVVSVVIALLCELIGRRSPSGPIMCALGLVVGLHLVDAFSGLHLEFNTPFGYSSTIGIRLAGIGNQTFAQLSAAAVLLAGFIAARDRPRRRALAIGLLGITLVALIAPFFGQNFGATLAATPAFVVFAWLVAGRRVRVRHAIALGAIIVGAGLLVGFVDLLRPAKQRTHIGRFFSQVGNHGWSGFSMVIDRKASANFETFSNTGWLLLIVASLALLVFLVWGPPRLLREVPDAPRAVRATAASLATLMILGYAFKDSGIAVPAMMLGVTLAVLAFVMPDHLATGFRPQAGPEAEVDESRHDRFSSRSG